MGIRKTLWLAAALVSAAAPGARAQAPAPDSSAAVVDTAAAVPAAGVPGGGAAVEGARADSARGEGGRVESAPADSASVPARPGHIMLAAPGLAAEDAGTDLQAAVNKAKPGSLIRLGAGTYDLAPRPYLEPICGNCQAETTAVNATVGLLVKGENLRIVGPRDGKAVIRTHAGYGIVFDDCHNCGLSEVTVTGGERDTSAAATDAAVMVKNGAVAITDCDIRDNVGDTLTVARTVVGIIGVAGRENSVVTVRGCRILRNSWDGIALYRDSQGVIEANVIDGVDLARGARVGGGRGVGIGCTWNSFASIRGNLVRRYWKGIGVFVDAQVTAQENLVEHVATWGVTLWDAGKGRPSGIFERNVIYDTGACGASIVRATDLPPPPGRFVQNVIVHTGQDPRYDSGEPYCFQLPIARHAVPGDYAVAGNVLFENRIAGGAGAEGDLDRATFENRMRPLWDKLGSWPAVRESDFWKAYGPAN